MGLGHFIHHAAHSVSHAISHGVKEVTHAAQQVVHNVEHAVTHPVQTISSVGKNLTKAADDLVHGRVMSTLQDIGHAADPAHLWHPVVSAIEHNPLSHAVAQVWHGVERPVNRELQTGIKKLTGHNVFGAHPLTAVAEIAATVMSMGTAGGLIGGIEAGAEGLASSLGEYAAANAGTFLGTLAEGGSAVAEVVGEGAGLIESAEEAVTHVISQGVSAVNQVAENYIPGLQSAENWVGEKATEASNFFSKTEDAVKNLFTPEQPQSLVTPYNSGLTSTQSFGPASYGGEATGGGWSPNYLSRGGAQKAMAENLGEGAWNTSGLVSAGKAGMAGGSMYGPEGILTEGVGFTPSMLGRTAGAVSNASTGAVYAGPGAQEAMDAGGYYGSAITNGGAFGPFGSAGFKGAMDAFNREQQDDNSRRQNSDSGGFNAADIMNGVMNQGKGDFNVDMLGAINPKNVRDKMKLGTNIQYGDTSLPIAKITAFQNANDNGKFTSKKLGDVASQYKNLLGF